MTKPAYYYKKPGLAAAVQFELGVSTKTEMLIFCPIANIGTPVNDERSIRWFLVPSPGEDLYVADGDWIVKDANNRFYVYPPELFEQEYTLFEDDRKAARATSLSSALEELVEDLEREGNACGSGCIPGAAHRLRTILDSFRDEVRRG